MHVKSNNIEAMIANKTDETIRKKGDSLLQRYQKGLEESMKGSELDFYGVDLLNYKCYKISFNRGGSRIYSLKLLKNKKAIINLKHLDDEKIFQYPVTVALNHESIVENPQRISKIKAFINQCKWKKVIFFIAQKVLKKFETNNKTIVLMCCANHRIVKK